MSNYPKNAVDNLLYGLSKHRDHKDLIKDFHKDCDTFKIVKKENSTEQKKKPKFIGFLKNFPK